MKAGAAVNIVKWQTVFTGRVVNVVGDIVIVLVTGFVVCGKAFKYADDSVMRVSKDYVVEVCE